MPAQMAPAGDPRARLAAGPPAAAEAPPPPAGGPRPAPLSALAFLER